MDTNVVDDATTAGLIDLTDVSLDVLWTMADDDALTLALRRVTAPAQKEEHVPVSAFNSAIG